jgi:excisionase family DNA binding protein
MTLEKNRRFVTVSEFAELLGVHQNTIYRAIKRRDLDGVSRIPSGRSIRIDVPVALASMRRELPRAFHHI